MQAKAATKEMRRDTKKKLRSASGVEPSEVANAVLVLPNAAGRFIGGDLGLRVDAEGGFALRVELSFADLFALVREEGQIRFLALQGAEDDEVVPDPARPDKQSSSSLKGSGPSIEARPMFSTISLLLKNSLFWARDPKREPTRRNEAPGFRASSAIRWARCCARSMLLCVTTLSRTLSRTSSNSAGLAGSTALTTPIFVMPPAVLSAGLPGSLSNRAFRNAWSPESSAGGSLILKGGRVRTSRSNCRPTSSKPVPASRAAAETRSVSAKRSRCIVSWRSVASSSSRTSSKGRVLAGSFSCSLMMW